jgi:hypothetical protein
MSPIGWFEPNAVYEGYGRAEFGDPRGYVEGPIKIEFDEAGHDRVAMTEVENYRNESALSSEFDLKYLLTGVAPTKFLSGWSMGWPLPVKNRCINLEIRTDDPQGAFVFDTPISHYPLDSPFAVGGTMGILFLGNRSAFLSANAERAKYWVLPLKNFVMDRFVQLESTRSPHPLRIDPQNAWIPFDFNGTPAFIDPLADYDDRKKKLLSGQARSLFTAVIVGEVGENSPNWDGIEAWLPFYYFETMLGLVTGSPVATPWIEFRDETGGLIKRLHMLSPDSAFTKGHAAIRAFHRGGASRLLSACQSSPFYENRSLKVVINLLVDAGDEKRTVEERLSLVFRAFEALGKILGIDAPSTKELLTEGNYDKLKGILSEAEMRIKEVAKNIEIPSTESGEEISRKVGEKRRLERIANRMNNVSDVKLKFGELVSALSRKMGFVDVDVVIPHFGSERKWQDYLTGEHRASIMHGGYLRSKEELDKGWRLLCHLHDLGIRIVLKLLSYDGNYCPVMVKVPLTNISVDENIDWVTSTCKASDLGYINKINKE